MDYLIYMAFLRPSIDYQIQILVQLHSACAALKVGSNMIKGITNCFFWFCPTLKLQGSPLGHHCAFENQANRNPLQIKRMIWKKKNCVRRIWCLKNAKGLTCLWLQPQLSLYIHKKISENSLDTKMIDEE